MPHTTHTSNSNAAASTLRVLSPVQTAALGNGALVRLLRPACPRVLIGARGEHLFAFHANLITSVEPRQAVQYYMHRANTPIELKLPIPAGPLTESSRDVFLTLSGVQARISFDRLVATHRLEVEALADPQDLVPSTWLLGYFDLNGAQVAMIDPSALLPARLSPAHPTPRAA